MRQELGDHDFCLSRSHYVALGKRERKRYGEREGGGRGEREFQVINVRGFKKGETETGNK